MADTQSLIVATMQQTVEALGLAFRSKEQCAAMIGLPLKQTFTKLIPMTSEMGDKCAEKYTEIFIRNNTKDAVPLFPNVLETIKELKHRGCIVTIFRISLVQTMLLMPNRIQSLY